MVEQETIKVAIVVIVKERGLGRKTRESQPVGFRFFPEDGHPVGAGTVIDIEFVVAFGAPKLTHGTYVNIQQPVTVDIGHGGARLPVSVPRHTRSKGNVLKTNGFFSRSSSPGSVQIQLIRSLIRDKIQVRQPVVVHIPRRHAAPVVEIEVVDDVELRRFFHPIDKSHPRLRRIERDEKWGFGRRGTAP